MGTPMTPAAAADVLLPSGLRAVARSFDYCERVARRAAGNFYHAFRILPAEQRRAMCALYAFMRVADDLADGPGDPGGKRRLLEGWRRQLDAALDGAYHHPLHPALHRTVARFGVPRVYLDAVLDGVGMDLETSRYRTFAELYRYCYRVASAVGLACIHVWGFRDARATDYAESAGVAFQLTNILRDLGEDAARGRVYLPQEDLDRFGYRAEELARGRRDGRFRELMAFEAARARSYYDAAAPLAGLLPPPGRAVFLVMLRTYRGLLDAIVRRDYDVFSGRVRLSRLHKLWLAARALPVRWGWIEGNAERRSQNAEQGSGCGANL
jgi:phytoene synthase